jgi:hypothetical protein
LTGAWLGRQRVAAVVGTDKRAGKQRKQRQPNNQTLERVHDLSFAGAADGPNRKIENGGRKTTATLKPARLGG